MSVSLGWADEWECGNCSSVFPSALARRRHQATCLPESGLGFLCDGCQSFFTSDAWLVAHFPRCPAVAPPPAFSCDDCGSLLATPAGLSTHVTRSACSRGLPPRTAKTSGRRECSHCKSSFKSREGLSRHSAKCHQGLALDADDGDDMNVSTYCAACEELDGDCDDDACPRLQEAPLALDDDDDFVLSCDSCGSLFASQTGLAIHCSKPVCPVRRGGGGTKGTSGFEAGIRPACDSCGSDFASPTAIQRHCLVSLGCGTLNSAIALELEGVDANTCPQCAMTFSTTRGRNQHFVNCDGTAKPQRRVTCRGCGHESDTWNARVMHERTCDSVPSAYKQDTERYVCERCGASFNSVTNLTSHSSTGLDCTTRNCPMCDYTAARWKDMIMHLRQSSCGVQALRNKDNDSFCDSCGSVVWRTETLFNHMLRGCRQGDPLPPTKSASLAALRAWDLKARTCAGCAHPFGSVNDLNKHRHRYAGKPCLAPLRQERRPDAPTNCGRCGRRYADRHGLSKHKRESSCGQTAEFGCHRCGRAFVRTATLRIHIQRGFCSRAELAEHIRAAAKGRSLAACFRCPTLCPGPEELDRHCKTAHRQTPKPPPMNETANSFMESIQEDSTSMFAAEEGSEGEEDVDASVGGFEDESVDADIGEATAEGEAAAPAQPSTLHCTACSDDFEDFEEFELHMEDCG